MANKDLVLTPGRVKSFIGKPGPGGYKIYLTSKNGVSWVELGGGGVMGNPLGMPKQPKRGYPIEADAWSFAEDLLKQQPDIVEIPRTIFRLYDYAHDAEFYLSRSRPLQAIAATESPIVRYVELFDHARDPKSYQSPERPNQKEFRYAALVRYGQKCAFCRVSSEKLLDAAHVIPWAEKGADIPENALVLCKLHHRALDAGLLLIHPFTLQLHYSGELAATDLHVEVADLRQMPALPDGRTLQWLWERRSERQ